MIYSIKGTIKELYTNILIIENNGIEYLINTYVKSDINNNIKLYIYEDIKEFTHTLYGFDSLKSKEVFMKLLNVKGLGCKTALLILAKYNYIEIIDAINKGNKNFFKNVPKIGEKLASQIILDLKGEIINSSDNEKLEEVFINLGYKKKDIRNIIDKINSNIDFDKKIKEGLSLLRSDSNR